jgi:hypothetical protein
VHLVDILKIELLYTEDVYKMQDFNVAFGDKYGNQQPMNV